MVHLILAGLAALVGVFAAGYLLTCGSYTVPATVDADPMLPVIEANGYRFHGETFGDPHSPPVIVVHGGPGWDYHSLLPLAALADRYFVVFYDQRGSGLSPRVDAAELSYEGALTDLDAIVDRFRGNGRVALIGHSWGAMLATAYLGRHPEKVGHAVLAEPGFLNAEMLARSGIHLGPRWEAGYLWFAARSWFESLHIHEPDRDAARDYFLGLAASHANPEYFCAGRLPPAATDYWRTGSTAMSAIFRSTTDAQGRFGVDFTEGLPRYRGKVLLLASECNRLIGVAQQTRQARYYPRSELHVIRDSGHMMFTEQPEQTIAVVRRYLAEPPTAMTRDE